MVLLVPLGPVTVKLLVKLPTYLTAGFLVTLFEINVAKSTFSVPKIYHRNFKNIVDDLDTKIHDVYFKKNVYQPRNTSDVNTKEVILQNITSKGVLYTMNEENLIKKYSVRTDLC